MSRFSSLMLLLVLPLIAKWYNPVPIAIKPEDITIEEVISDGEGGAVVMWSEGGSNTYYLQRVDSSGRILWDPNGVAAFDVPEYVELRYPDFLRDENGNYWIAVTYNLDDYRHESDIYLQKISPFGERMFGNRGIAVCSAERSQSNPCLCPSGDGVIVGWRDLRFYESDDSIVGFAQRVGAEGSIMWSANGNLISEYSECYRLNCVTDEQDGVFFIVTRKFDSVSINFQHVDSIGARLWSDTGLVYFSRVTSNLNSYMIADGFGGFIFNYGYSGTRYQRIDSIGNPLWDTTIYVEGQPSPLSSSGFYICYGTWDSHADLGGIQGVGVSWISLEGTTNSAPIWVTGCGDDPIIDQGGLHTCVSQNGIIVWRDCTEYWFDYYGILAQRVDTSCRTLWTENNYDDRAINVCGISGVCPYVVATPDNGGIVMWQDDRNGPWCIYATKLDAYGNLPPGIEEQSPYLYHPTFEVLTSVGNQIVLRFADASGIQGGSITVFDAAGRQVDEIRITQPGTITWGEGFSTGVYFIRSAGERSVTKKVVLIK